MEKYGFLLKEKDIKRWRDNVARGSQITADVYLRRVGGFCNENNIQPNDLLKMNERKLYELLLDTVSKMEIKYAGSYIHSVIKSVKSWLSFNSIELKGKIKIKGAQDTPTLRNERVPTQQELRKIFLAGDLKTKVACALVAHSGFRMEVLGNYGGDDGLRIGDFPELAIKGKHIEFEKMPTLIKVRSQLSKKANEYFTFLSTEACEYMKEYLEMRMRSGEKLDEESAIITPKTAKNPFITSINIGDIIRQAIRKVGFKWRPYVLRSYFDTQLMLAESKGMIIRDWRAFFMGHKGDIEHVYTLNKRKLPPDIIEQMRQSYAKAQKYLQTVETAKEEENLKNMFRKQMLFVAGFKESEIKDEYFEMENDKFNKIMREKLVNEVQNNGLKQKVVEVSSLENYMQQGWEFVSVLPNNKAVMKLPELS